MTSRTGTQPSTSEDVLETRLEFPDNRLLIDLFGEFNRNLTHIESMLAVQIVHQGNQLAVHGDAVNVAKAAEVLDALYGRLEAGKDITPGDIDAEIRMGRGDEKRAPTDQMELFKGCLLYTSPSPRDS